MIKAILLKTEFLNSELGFERDFEQTVNDHLWKNIDMLMERYSSEENFHKMHSDLVHFCRDLFIVSEVSLEADYIPDCIVHQSRGYSKLSSAIIDGEKTVFYGSGTFHQHQETILDMFLFRETFYMNSVIKFINVIKENKQTIKNDRE